MATQSQFFRCRHCGEGVVKKTIKSTRKSLLLNVQDCSKCSASYGFGSLADLEPATLNLRSA